MARTIAEIKAEIGAAYVSHETVRSAYGLDENASFDKVFSPISVESILFYVVAASIWVLEQLFDRHTAEVERRIEDLRPHTLRWYVSMALGYMQNCQLVQTDGVVSADYYDTTRLSEGDIATKKIIKYAVATETNTQVVIKVAKAKADGRPEKLSSNEMEGFKYYLSQIKDAGVYITVVSADADKMNVELVVLYDPLVLNAEYVTEADKEQELRELIITDPNNGKEIIKETVQDVIARLPFNGEYRNSDLMAAVQAVEGVRVADISSVQVCSDGSDKYTDVIGYRRPTSGYYELENITIKGRAYKVIENDI